MVQNLSCSTRVIPVPLHRHVSLYCNLTVFMLQNTNTDTFMWSLLAVVANPTIDQKNI